MSADVTEKSSDSNKTPQSILIVLLGSLGDVMRGFAVLKPLKEAYPDVRVTWLVEPACAEIVKAHPLIDSVVVFERARGLRGVLKLALLMRRLSFDLTLDLQRHFKSGLFSYFSRSPRRVASHRSNSKEFNSIFNNEFIPSSENTLPKVRHYLKFVEYLGAKVSEPLDFGLGQLSLQELAGAKLALIGPRFIGLVMGSRWSSKDWVAAGYQRLAERLLKGVSERVVLLGDRSQQELAGALTRSLASDRIVDLTGRTSLLELVGIIKAAKVCVGPDSGPGHIAAAVGTPYVSLFGPTAPERVAPYGSEHLVVQSTLGCAPCWRRKCPGLNKLCMRSLSVDAVWDRVVATL